MFSNSKMSEIDPRGGVSIFQISLKFKKSLKYPIGGGGANLFGKKSQISLFFNYDASPKGDGLAPRMLSRVKDPVATKNVL